MRRAKLSDKKENAPALFLHIQKTAGSSIIEVASHHYGSSMTRHADCWGHAPEEFEAVGFVSGHFGYDFARHLISSRYSFTFLRDPVERVLSMYYFCKKRNPVEFEIYRRANELDLKAFLEAYLTDPWIKKSIWNNQVWQLAHGYAHLDDRTVNDFSESELLGLAKEHIGKFNYVGFTETIDRDGPAIFSALGVRQSPAIPKVNRTEARPTVSEVSSEVRSLLEELTFLDQQIYDYAWKKYMPTRGTREE